MIIKAKQKPYVTKYQIETPPKNHKITFSSLLEFSAKIFRLESRESAEISRYHQAVNNTETLRGSNSDSDSFCLWLFCLILQDFLETASTLFLLFSQTSSFKQYFHFSLLWGHRKPHPLTGASSARWGVKRRREALLPLQQPAGSVCQLLQLTLSLPSWPHATPGLADSFP